LRDEHQLKASQVKEKQHWKYAPEIAGSISTVRKLLGSQQYERVVEAQKKKEFEEAEKKRIVAEKKKIREELAD
jgi:hypothetical protein